MGGAAARDNLSGRPVLSTAAREGRARGPRFSSVRNTSAAARASWPWRLGMHGGGWAAPVPGAGAFTGFELNGQGSGTPHRLTTPACIKPVIDLSFPLEGIADAFRRQESGRHFGKICLEW
ncbi:zinc-binding dehydrogenase [Archangium violaceum]|uniref:zinc-binding dehydrogenase n=1 Tax=Archangium violaceum TaxID=83451 RepID=UPI003D2B3989